MKKVAVFSVSLLAFFCMQALNKSRINIYPAESHAIVKLQEDTIKERDRASQILRDLRNGSVVVRLKTNQKSVDAYRKSGQSNIADMIVEDRKKQNIKIYSAFKNYFHFCKVYFIYANETEEFRKGVSGIFLDLHLEKDSRIIMNDTNFVFCEYGSVESFSKFQDYEHPVGGVPDNNSAKTTSTQTATSPATTSGLVFLDKDLQQLHRPFPFVAGVYMENYDAPVRALDRELERAYQRLVVAQDFKTEMKAQRKKDKQKRKSEPRYNPFK